MLPPCLYNCPKRLCDVVHPPDAGGVALWPNQHKVIVHHRIALHAFAFGDKFLFCRFRMDKNHVCIAAPAGVERLTGAPRQYFHRDAGLLREERQQVVEQATILC
jgi:hypothetical protein